MAKKLSSSAFRLSVAPESGADATTYWLVPSTTQVKRKADGTHTPEYVSCEAMSKTGEGNPVAGIGTIKFTLTYKTGSSSIEFLYASRIIVTSDMAAIIFKQYVGGSVVDTKTVTVVDDGQDGGEGLPGPIGPLVYPAGKYDDLIPYTRTSLSAPMVLCEKLYYLLNKEGTFTGINPKEDYAANGKKATWVYMEKVEFAFYEILMANFAKLASAVFFGDYMFSQHGKDASGNATAGYDKFVPTSIGQSGCPFTPNLMMDLLKGEFRLGDEFVASIKNGKLEIVMQGRLQTANAGQRIVIDPETSSFTFYEADGAKGIQISSKDDGNGNIRTWGEKFANSDRSYSDVDGSGISAAAGPYYGFYGAKTSLISNGMGVHIQNIITTDRNNSNNEVSTIQMRGFATSPSQVLSGCAYVENGFLKIKS